MRLRALANRRVHARHLRSGTRPPPEHLLVGERGEDLAFHLMRAQGFTVVARRWHAARLRGDLDLVAWDGDTLVVVEVKTRSSKDFAPPESAVDAEKKATLRRMALAYRGRLPRPWRDAVPLRFDLLSIYNLSSGAEWSHVRNAFPLREASSRWPRS